MSAKSDSLPEKWPVGARVLWPGASEGVIVENFKMPGDICIKWRIMPFACSYDEWFLEERGVRIIEEADSVTEA